MASLESSAGELGETPLSATQDRILSAALELFAEHGVNGTSYQMVADTLGVTKAAIYHQFKTKDDIVIAVTERELSKLGDALAAAEAEKSHTKARELLLNAVVDHAVEHRRAASTLQFDPVIVRLLSAHKPFQLFVERLYRALIGDDTGRKLDSTSRSCRARSVGQSCTRSLLTSMKRRCEPGCSIRPGAYSDWATHRSFVALRPLFKECAKTSAQFCRCNTTDPPTE